MSGTSEDLQPLINLTHLYVTRKGKYVISEGELALKNQVAIMQSLQRIEIKLNK